MDNDSLTLISGEVLNEHMEFSFTELCRLANLPDNRLLELIDQGVIEPRGREPAQWRFTAVSVRRVHYATRLERDLGVNAAGAALALELLDELKILRTRLRHRL